MASAWPSWGRTALTAGWPNRPFQVEWSPGEVVFLEVYDRKNGLFSAPKRFTLSSADGAADFPLKTGDFRSSPSKRPTRRSIPGSTHIVLNSQLVGELEEPAESPGAGCRRFRSPHRHQVSLDEARGGSGVTTRLSFDRFEGKGKQIAVLVADDGTTLNVPKSLLPAGAKPGDVLILSLEIDPAATAQAQRGDPARAGRAIEARPGWRYQAVTIQTVLPSPCDLPGRGRVLDRPRIRRRPSSFGVRLAHQPVTIEVLDVGQGDSILIRSPEGKTALIDAGPTKNAAVTALKRAGDHVARPGGDQSSPQRPLRRHGRSGEGDEAALFPGQPLGTYDVALSEAAQDRASPGHDGRAAVVEAPQDRAGLTSS